MVVPIRLFHHEGYEEHEEIRSLPRWAVSRSPFFVSFVLFVVKFNPSDFPCMWCGQCAGSADDDTADPGTAIKFALVPNDWKLELP